MNFLKAHTLQVIIILIILILVISVVVILFIIKSKRKNKIMAEDSLKLQIGNVHNIGNRESQQDSFGISDISSPKLLSENGVLAVVADGMGGLAGGAEISAIVTSYMLKYFANTNNSKKVSDQLLDMLYGANREVRKYLNNNGNQMSGSTVVAVVVKENTLHFLAVGDSRIYLCRGGVLLQLNREHTYGSELDEQAAKGEISIEEARNDSQRNALTSYIGMDEIAHIDRNLKPIPLMTGDRIYLMSDGVFGTLSEEEIIAAATPDLYDTAAQVEKAVLNKGKNNQDNFTAIIIEIK